MESEYQYLMKPHVYMSDLSRVRRETRELKKIIQDYIDGKETVENFRVARNKINTLAILVKAAACRMKKHSDKNRLRIMK